MNKTTFHIPKMDCGAEEQLIRMKLDGDLTIRKLDFNLPERKLIVFHEQNSTAVAQKLSELKLGSTLVKEESVEDEILPADKAAERRLLWTVFFINFGSFLMEIFTGIVARSMGLIADSLDMLADAAVFALSLLVVGKALASKKKVAGISGYLQLALAIYGIFEVSKRFFGNEPAPNFGLMIIISVIALAGNATTLYLLQRAKSKEVHIKAGSIFITNDVIINLGVVAAGILVYFTQSKIPDLVIGGVVFLIVGRGAFQILKLAK
jgi:Co/Zn/Cd efflux system component